MKSRISSRRKINIAITQLWMPIRARNQGPQYMHGQYLQNWIERRLWVRLLINWASNAKKHNPLKCFLKSNEFYTSIKCKNLFTKPKDSLLQKSGTESQERWWKREDFQYPLRVRAERKNYVLLLKTRQYLLLAKQLSVSSTLLTGRDFTNVNYSTVYDNETLNHMRNTNREHILKVTIQKAWLMSQIQTYIENNKINLT